MAHNRKNKDTLKWARAFEASLQKKELKPDGVGWYTVKELKDQFKVGLNRVHKFVRDGAENGTVEVFEGTAINNTGRQVRRVWYRLK